MTDETINPEHLFLRTCRPDGESYNGFRWPLKVGATVTAPDWNPDPVCGGGLHGLHMGCGQGGLLDWSEDAVWLVFASPDRVDIDSAKSKVRSAMIMHVGDQRSATQYLRDAGCTGAIVGGTATAGYYGTATAGDGGTATAGGYGTATAGYRGTATAGDFGVIQIKHWDGKRYRISTGYIGEDGLEADRAYRLDSKGKFVEATQ